MQTYSKIKYKQGTLLEDESTGKQYQVLACIDLNWITQGEKDGYIISLKEFYGTVN